MTPKSRIATLARRQFRVITADQLASLGCSPEVVRHLVRTEFLWPVHRRVYALEGPLPPAGRALAAAMRLHPFSFTSHLTAAAVHGYTDDWPRRPHITITRRTGAQGPETIHTHRARHVAGDFGHAGIIPVTSPLRTAVDCAPLLDEDDLKQLLRRMEHKGVDLAAFDRPGLPRRLTRILDRYVIGSGLTANDLEADFYEICAAASLRLPEIQEWMPDHKRVDFVWHDIRLIVETDGRATHDSFIAFTDDRRRDRRHTLAGYTTMRFTWFEVSREPALVAADLVAAHERLSRR